MLKHGLCSGVVVPDPYLIAAGQGWNPAEMTMQFADVLAHGDPFIAFFEKAFRHRMSQPPMYGENLLLANTSNYFLL